MQEKLNEIARAAAEGADPQTLVAELEALHEELMQASDDETRADFEREVLHIANGIYLPHIFWMYLAPFLDKAQRETYRPFLEYILQVYAQLPCSSFVDKRMRPLLYVYLTEEAPFYVDKLNAFLGKYAHPDKQALFQEVRAFIQRNPNTVRIFREKFRLLKDYVPDFDMLAMPLPTLRTSLGQKPLQ